MHIQQLIQADKKRTSKRRIAENSLVNELLNTSISIKVRFRQETLS